MTATPAPADLCTACGLCCSGALFDFGALEPGEVEQARADGMAILAAKDEVGFALPCPALDGAFCIAYATRPATCRTYRCELLRACDAGQIAPADALPIIARARDAAAAVLAQLPPDETITDARRRRREAAASDGAAMLIAPPGLMIALGMLDLVLDEHFRKPGERQVMPRGE
ncbi:MAG: YkgJ family cysteine cluster protein [Porphyrobacter sp.]|nr:YkgJ family cysteine cluster protein [Porphyrobacter sp.]